MVLGCSNNKIPLIINTIGVVKMTQSNLSNSSFSSNQNFNPQIYVACLASYNNGVLYGCWCDATEDQDLINDQIQTMLSNSSIPNAEEYSIHDYSDFGSLHLCENESLSTVHDLALFIKEHGELGAKLIGYLGDLECAQNALESNYHGSYDSELSYAIDLFDDCYIHDVPKNIRYYIDYEAFCRDLFMSDFYSISVDGDVHVFSNH